MLFFHLYLRVACTPMPTLRHFLHFCPSRATRIPLFYIAMFRSCFTYGSKQTSNGIVYWMDRCIKSFDLPKPPLSPGYEHALFVRKEPNLEFYVEAVDSKECLPTDYAIQDYEPITVHMAWIPTKFGAYREFASFYSTVHHRYISAVHALRRCRPLFLLESTHPNNAFMRTYPLKFSQRSLEGHILNS